jgi:thioredoxin:protein disulfide reductase
MSKANGRDLPPPPASPVGTLIVFVLLVMAGVVAVREFLLTPPKSASASLTDGQSHPTLMLFTADWCPACRALDSQTLSKPHVKSAINARGVRFVVVDLSQSGGPNEALARQHNVKGIPAMVLLDNNGTTRDRIVGAVPPDQFIKWLDKHISK